MVLIVQHIFHLFQMPDISAERPCDVWTLLVLEAIKHSYRSSWYIYMMILAMI